MSGAIDRVVVTIDASSESHPAIDTAVRLAARAKAPIHGIFVEDEDLLHLADLPFARQITHGGESRPLTREAVELHLRAAAERACRELFAAAEAFGVKGSFEILRAPSANALGAIGERDFAVAGALTRPVAGQFRLECRWWSSINTAQGPVLLARHAWAAAGSVVTLLRDKSPAAERLLMAAVQVAEAGGAPLNIICPPALMRSGSFEQWLTDRAGPARVRVHAAPEEPSALHELVSGLDCRLLAIDAATAEDRGGLLRELAARLACDLLIVR